MLSLNSKIINIILYSLFILIFLSIFSYKKYIYIPSFPIINKSININNEIILDTLKGSYRLVPVEKYETNAKVILKERYIGKDQGDIIPYDLVLGWGNMKNKESLYNIDFWQKNRWYYFQTNGKQIESVNYISTHTANTHIIPANESIYNIINNITSGEILTLKGRLVNIYFEGTILRSSKTRNDTGGGACEIMYVEEILK